MDSLLDEFKFDNYSRANESERYFDSEQNYAQYKLETEDDMNHLQVNLNQEELMSVVDEEEQVDPELMDSHLLVSTYKHLKRTNSSLVSQLSEQRERSTHYQNMMKQFENLYTHELIKNIESQKQKIHTQKQSLLHKIKQVFKHHSVLGGLLIFLLLIGVFNSFLL